MTKNPFLKRAYCLKNQQDTLSMYGDWAATYDETMKDHDYQSPRRIVEALLRHCADTVSYTHLTLPTICSV